jgi:hypothetical protein
MALTEEYLRKTSSPDIERFSPFLPEFDNKQHRDKLGLLNQHLEDFHRHYEPKSNSDGRFDRHVVSSYGILKTMKWRPATVRKEF